MDLNTAYAFGKTVDMPYGEAEQKVREELAKEGFGVLTEIDVKKKFSEKLQKEFRNYIILGACNPPLPGQGCGRLHGINQAAVHLSVPLEDLRQPGSEPWSGRTISLLSSKNGRNPGNRQTDCAPIGEFKSSFFLSYI